MNGGGSLTHQIESVLWNPRAAQLPLPSAAGLKLVRFIYANVRDALTGQLTLRAMGLVYITILSMVPVLAISFSVLKAFDFHLTVKPFLENLLLPLGERGSQLIDQVMGFVDNVQGDVLAGLGLIMLFFTAVSMAQRVEDSMNYVWRVSQSRSFARRMSEYLSLILVGPVVMVTAMGLIAALRANQLVQEVEQLEPVGTGLSLLGRLGPYLLVMAGFSFVYWLIPNTRVRFSAALVGGIIAGFLWAGTGVVFANTVVTATRTFSIYATFAIVIMAFIWLYLCWLILLVGGQVAFYYQNPEHMRLGHRSLQMGNREREQLALSIMLLTAQTFKDREKSMHVAELAAKLNMTELGMTPVLNRLDWAGLLTQGGRRRLQPAQDPSTMLVLDILAAVREPMSRDTFPPGQWPETVSQLDDSLNRGLTETVAGMTLADLASLAGKEIPRAEPTD